MKKLFLILPILFATGCAGLKDHTLVTTGTVLGVQLAENQVTGMYEAKLGYSRVEVAFVPTNNINVLMEFKTSGLFSFSSSGGIYQRLAIGNNAVVNSAPLFLKDRNGLINTNVAAVVQSLLLQHNTTNK